MAEGIGYVYAALLLHSLDKEITEEKVMKVVKAAGAKPEITRVKALVTALGEVKIDEVLKGAATTVAQPTVAPAEPKGEPKAEERVGKEEILEGLSGLFG